MECLDFPIVDVSTFHGDGRGAIMEMINDACQSWGAFELVNHGLSDELMDRVHKLTKLHDNLCKEQKFRQIMADQGIEMAVENEKYDLCRKITFILSHLPDSNTYSLPYLNLGHYNYTVTMEEFAANVRKLAEKILELMDENLGFERSYLRRVFCGSRGPTIDSKVSNYPQCPDVPLFKGIKPHSDPGGIILIFQNDDQVSGLQFFKDGQWVDMPLIKHSIVVILGDQLEVISNGKYKSCMHRVLARQNENKMYVTSFYNPSDDALIFPFPGLKLKEGENGSMEYPEYVYEEYVKVYKSKKYGSKEARLDAIKAKKQEEDNSDAATTTSMSLCM